MDFTLLILEDRPSLSSPFKLARFLVLASNYSVTYSPLISAPTPEAARERAHPLLPRMP